MECRSVDEDGIEIAATAARSSRITLNVPSGGTAYAYHH